MEEEIGNEERSLEEIEEEEIAKPSFTRQDFKLVSFMLEDTNLPDPLKKLFWAFGSKVMALTNLDDVSVKQLLRDWRDARITYMMSRPYYKFTYDEQLAISNFEAWFFATLKRSTGETQRERFIIGAQITQRMGEIEAPPRGGILNTVKRAFGLGGR